MEGQLNELQSKIQKQKEILEGYQRQSHEVSVELQRQKEKVNSQEEIQKARAELDNQIAELASRFEAEKAKYDEYRAKFNLTDQMEALEFSKNYIRNEVENLKSSATEARRRIDELNAEYQQSEEKIHQKLLNLRPLVKAINGAPVGGEVALRDVRVAAYPLEHQGATIDRQNKVVEAVGSGLAAAGRPMSRDFLVNLIVSTQQSFITFFAGLPGVGKTSLARLYAEAQGLEERFLEVAVARGWTGTKDLVGFFNPLSGRYQPSSTGVANFLLSFKEEVEAGSAERAGMSYILLDEANLSPVEHYWSAFSNMADPVKQRSLNMGPADTCQIPLSMRFLATINYDGTTETLSDRILDRAPVIVMEPGSVRERDLADVSAMAARLPLPYAEMEELFGRAASMPEMSPDEESVLEKICEVLSSSTGGNGRPIHVSMRKMGSIRQYCNKVTGLMSDPAAALDFAVLQHVLPQVHGHGKPFEVRLRQLSDVLSRFELNRSRDYVEKMIRHGSEDLHSYSFFCW